MASISLKPLIEIYIENHYENIEDNDDYVILGKKGGDEYIDKVMIPKNEEDKEEYLSIITRKINRLINSSANSDEAEQFEFQKNILKLSVVTNNDKLSFRIRNTNHVKLDKIKKIITRFSSLAQKYGDLIGDSSFSENLDFLQTTKGSFVINVSMPQQNTLIEGFNKNQAFIDILSDTSKNNFNTILGNYQQIEGIKQFIGGLKEFSDEVLGETEMFYMTKFALNKIIDIIPVEQKREISESLKEIEDNIQNILQYNSKEFLIVSVSNPIGNRIAKVQLSTTLDGTNDVDFFRSGVSNEDFSYIKQRNSNDESIFLKNIKSIKLKDYYRIISAEVIRDCE